MAKIKYKKPNKEQVKQTARFLKELDYLSATLCNSALNNDYWSICLLNGRIQSLAEQSQTIKDITDKRIILDRKDVIYG